VYIATGCGVDACGFIPGRIFSEERRLTGMWRHVALVRTDVWEERIATIIRVTRISALGTTLAVTSNLFTQVIESICSSQTCVLWRATRRHIPEYGILQSRRRENLKAYIILSQTTVG
jgi:hypothetical protein